MADNIKNYYDVIIIGAGYAGSVASILCARNNKKVCLIDKNTQVARKILSTGNGRCNFTNSDMSLSNFYSQSDISDFEFNTDNSVNFFKELGVIEKNINNYFYPITNQAKTIREALENEILELDIDLKLDTEVLDLKKEDIYKVKTYKEILESPNVIIATGGLAASSLGSTGDGFKFAKSLGLKVTKLYPSLVGTKSKDLKLKTIAGARVQGVVKFKDYSLEGEIQFNKDGISGYPVMCISRYISMAEAANEDLSLTVDFVPYLNSFELSKDIEKRVCRNIPISKALNGLTNDKCIELILNTSNISLSKKACELSQKEQKKIGELLKNMTFSLLGTKGFDGAQVTSGGIPLNEINHKTMEVTNKNLRGLYFIGEVCDVDGICGGYNLQWALESAFIAAKSINSK